MSAKELQQRRVAFKLTQVELSILTGILQSSISRLERCIYLQRPLKTAAASLLEKILDYYSKQKPVSFLFERKSQATKVSKERNDSIYVFAMDSTAKFHAILIDDDPAYNYLNELLFEQIPAFHPPRFFADSKAALAFIEAYCIKSKQHPFPHLTMVDVNMPVMDGYDFVEQLRVLCPEVHERTLLCFLSSSAHPKDQQHIRDIGVDCYFEKPLMGKHLETLASQLRDRFLSDGSVGANAGA